MLRLFVGILCVFTPTLGFEDKTVAEYLRDNGYTQLYNALSSQKLDTALSGTGPFTVFAPTDAAFTKLGNATLSSLSDVQLSIVLKYHVVQDYLILPMIKAPVSKITLDGQSVNIVPVSGGLLLNNVSHVNTNNGDIICNNGVVHPIDTVLIPPQLPSENIAQILLRDDARFKDLFLTLFIAELEPVLLSGDWTLFAPVDAAFAVYKDNLLDPTSPNALNIYQAVMKYHLVPGGRRAAQLKNGSMYTFHGPPVNVTISSGGVMVNTAKVIDADILATNGIIHAIDKVLIPPDINQIAQGKK